MIVGALKPLKNMTGALYSPCKRYTNGYGRIRVHTGRIRREREAAQGAPARSPPLYSTKETYGHIPGTSGHILATGGHMFNILAIGRSYVQYSGHIFDMSVPARA